MVQGSPAFLKYEIFSHSCLKGFSIFYPLSFTVGKSWNVVCKKFGSRIKGSIFIQAEIEQTQVQCHFCQAHMHVLPLRLFGNFVALNSHLVLCGWIGTAEVMFMQIKYSAVQFWHEIVSVRNLLSQIRTHPNFMPFWCQVCCWRGGWMIQGPWNIAGITMSELLMRFCWGDRNKHDTNRIHVCCTPRPLCAICALKFCSVCDKLVILTNNVICSCL